MRRLIGVSTTEETICSQVIIIKANVAIFPTLVEIKTISLQITRVATCLTTKVPPLSWVKDSTSSNKIITIIASHSQTVIITTCSSLSSRTRSTIWDQIAALASLNLDNLISIITIKEVDSNHRPFKISQCKIRCHNLDSNPAIICSRLRDPNSSDQCLHRLSTRIVQRFLGLVSSKIQQISSPNQIIR